MGYYAQGSGSFHIVSEIPEVVLEKANEHFMEMWIESPCVIVNHFGNYHEDDIVKGLKLLAPYCDSGEMEFRGEDDSQWKVVLKDGKIDMVNGRVAYYDEPALALNEERRAEFLGQIIDAMQDSLDETHIKHTIKGEEYDRLRDRLLELMKNWGVL